MEKVSRDDLTGSQINALETKVLPTARRWVREYPDGDSLHEHGKKTLEYWNEASA